MDVLLKVHGVDVPIDGEVFAALFKNSVVSHRAGVDHTLEGQSLTLKEFLKLSRQAEIPYPLFFAPLDVVEAQLRLKTEKLMAGFTRESFSMHSRTRVELHEVELIVKDLLRKQELLRKHDKSLRVNKVVGLLKNSTQPVPEDAQRLMQAIGLGATEIRDAKNRDVALELLITRLESSQILVSRSAKDHMPQTMPPKARFSGMTVKDKKVPYVFLATGDEGEHLEPTGRKLFTLTLLTVLIARDKFAPVNYDGHTKEAGSPREYELTAEILMPAAHIRSREFDDLESIKAAAETYRVTPSAVAMRVWRLGLIGTDAFQAYMDELKDEYAARAESQKRSALPINALKKYNGIECSRRMLRILDAGQIGNAEFRRIMFFNKLPASQIRAFREAVG